MGTQEKIDEKAKRLTEAIMELRMFPDDSIDLEKIIISVLWVGYGMGSK